MAARRSKLTKWKEKLSGTLLGNYSIKYWRHPHCFWVLHVMSFGAPARCARESSCKRQYEMRINYFPCSEIWSSIGVRFLTRSDPNKLARFYDTFFASHRIERFLLFNTGH